jgi:hypothetical protein
MLNEIVVVTWVSILQTSTLLYLLTRTAVKLLDALSGENFREQDSGLY